MNIKLALCALLLIPASAGAASLPTGTNFFVVSSKGKADGSGATINNGALFGPDTPGTTTSGLQEAINAFLTSTSLHTPPAGGGKIILEPGTYLCTSQITISNRFANPISIEGVSDAPSTIIRLRPGSTLDGILSTAPAGTGNLSLNLRNIVLAYEGIFKKRVMKLTDVQRLQCDNVYFCSWGFVTNGGLDGNVFSTYTTAHGASVVGVELGSYDFSDNPFGLAIFNNCRFADLAAGAYTSIDHTWFNKCHFLLIGGSNRNAPSTNNWAVGGSFTVPDSMYALHPGIVNYSLNGDVRVDDPNIYFTYCFLLNAHQGAFGHPLIRNTTASGLESSAWVLLQYDDLNNGNAGQTVEIESAPEPALMGNISLVAKPGTITNRYPANVRFSKNASYVWGATTNLAIAKIAGSTAGAGYAGFDAGVSAGQNRFLGTNVLEQLDAGITVDQSTLVVSGGTDTGINGTYYLSDRMYVESSAGGAVNIFSWTNTTWAVVVNADTANSINGGNLGAFYKLGDSFITNCFYVGQGLTLYPGYTLPVSGTYVADLAGSGTPPTVAFTYRTNTSHFGGSISVAGITNTGLSASLPVYTDANKKQVSGTAPVTSYASGTAYTLTATPAQLTFGTTSPSVTLATAGTYLITGTAGVKYAAATYAGAQTITLKLRRTNNTAADLTNGGRAVELPVLTTFTGGDVMSTPSVIYTATAGDIVQLFGSVSATPSAGSVQTDSAEIIAIRLY